MSSWSFDSTRIGALTDGIFAIAMTLLVLDLQLPEVEVPSDSSVMGAELADQLPRFISWLMSFAILCRLWTVNHDLLAGSSTLPRGFATWSFVFLGAVSFIPYPTSLLAEHPDQPLSVTVFSATYVVAGIAVGRMRWVLDRSVPTEGEPQAKRGISRSMLVILVTAAISCLLALVDARLGAAVWLTYPFIGGLVRRHDRRGIAENTHVDP